MGIQIWIYHLDVYMRYVVTGTGLQGISHRRYCIVYVAVLFRTDSTENSSSTCLHASYIVRYVCACTRVTV